jgi:putative nucleotidyltransferase with HDIG domain
MNRLTVVTDSLPKFQQIQSQLACALDVRHLAADRLDEQAPDENLLFDIDLSEDRKLDSVHDWLKRKAKRGNIIFVGDGKSPAEALRAASLKATNFCKRPVSCHTILTILLGDFDSLALDKTRPPIRNFPAVGPAIDALESIFSSSRFGRPLEVDKIQTANEALSEVIASKGLTSWIETVRKHHSQTYQHSLLVSGVAAAFARSLGFSLRDQRRISFGAMLHDLGKVSIPVAILEKPAALDDDEMVVMRQHPELGYESLIGDTEISREMLEMILHHHELLDGSGYPHRLQAEAISDEVRIMTVCDIYSALIERRSYKEPMSAEAAYGVLRDMGSKLDKHLVREFGAVTRAMMT